MARDTIAGDFDYEAKGAGYTVHRQPDPRIEAQVHAALGDARTVLNVGAGAGSYEPADRHVVAVEPSASMRSLRPPPRVPAIDATAEDLPFDDAAFDASMAMITVHQWSDRPRGLAEMRRVTKGPVVVLTFDGESMPRFWLEELCPEIIRAELGRFPDIGDLAHAIGPVTEVQDVPIPFDCTDGFGQAYYGRPEAFLDPEVRAGQSGWAFIGEEAELAFVERLRAALESGEWDRRYGHLRTQPSYEGSVRLLVGRRA
jgi:hypothetical protein